MMSKRKFALVVIIVAIIVSVAIISTKLMPSRRVIIEDTVMLKAPLIPGKVFTPFDVYHDWTAYLKQGQEVEIIVKLIEGEPIYFSLFAPYQYSAVEGGPVFKGEKIFRFSCPSDGEYTFRVFLHYSEAKRLFNGSKVYIKVTAI